MRNGLSLWIWPGGRGEGWKSAHQQADRALALGATGVIAQSGLSAPVWLAGRDKGDAVPRFEVFQQAGLQVTAGLGMDGSEATVATITRAVVDAVDLPNVLVMADEEKMWWETPTGRAAAKSIVAAVIKARPLAPTRGMCCPWWKPEVHSGAPDHEFFPLFHHFFCQDYGARGKDAPLDNTLSMLAHSRESYAKRGISPDHIHLAFQLYAHSLANAGRIVLCGEPVMAGWDVEEMDEHMHLALLARARLIALGYLPSRGGLVSFQAGAGITADGILGPVTLRALAISMSGILDPGLK